MKVQPVRAVFESLKDPLGDRRRGQALGGTLRMVFLARVSGENSERGIAAWVEEQRWRLKGIFGFSRDDVRSDSPIQRALQGVDAQALGAALVVWASQLQPAADGTA